MSVKLIRDVSLSPLSTMNIGGKAFAVAEIKSKEDIVELIKLSKSQKKPLVIIGEGSNTIFNDKKLPIILGIMSATGISIVRESSKNCTLKIESGTHWDDVVEYAVINNLSGIEAMSAIPGSAGATPVQNVGAYGQEIKDTLKEVEVFDTEKKSWKTLTKDACKLSYRNSIFKKSPGKFIISSITITLNKGKLKIPNYPNLIAYLKNHDIENPTLRDIRNAVIDIRSNKLPDPAEIPNCGSFFKNPIISSKEIKRLEKEYPDIPTFKTETGKFKIPAGWLIENAGLKGKDFGEFEVYKNNALVLTNKGNGSYKKLRRVIKIIIDSVYKKFGVTIDPEPNFVE